MNKKVITILILLLILTLSACGNKLGEISSDNDVQINETSNEPAIEETIPIAITLSEINNETIKELEQKGLQIESIEESDTYGKVIFGTIKSDKIEKINEIGKVTENIDEIEYKKEILKDMVLASGVTDYTKSSEDLDLFTRGQVYDDLEKEKEGRIGPEIKPIVWEKLKENNQVFVGILFNVQDWANWENNTQEIKDILGDDLTIESSGYRAIRGYITKAGLEKIKDKDYLKMISIAIE